MYFSHFPLERGKWRLWKWFVRRRAFRDPALSSGVRRLRYGFSMNLNTADYLGKFLYYWGCWEPNETWVVRKYLRPGDTFIDVGANIGYFALLASKLVGERGRVIAFEPVPPTVVELRKNLLRNNTTNVDVYGVAVSDTNGTVTVSQPHDENIMANTMRMSTGARLKWEVPSAPLPHWLNMEGPIRMIKIDVEGAELLVLRGIQNSFEVLGWPLILCEITDTWLRELGGSATELFGILVDQGYRSHRCDNLCLTPIDLGSVGGGDDNYNVLFSHHSQSI